MQTYIDSEGRTIINSSGATVITPEEVIVPDDVTPPSVPTALQVTSFTHNSISISFTASTDNVEVTGYDVFVNDVFNKSITGTTTTIGSLSQWTTYSIKVRAYDAAGNKSAFTSNVSQRTADITPPSVSTIGYVDSTHDTITITMTNSIDSGSGFKEWDVYVDGDYAGSTVSSPYTIPGLLPNTEFLIAVKSVDNENNESAFSNILTITTENSPIGGGVNAPTNLVRTVNSSIGFEITFNASVPVDYPIHHYRIYNGITLIGRTTDTVYGVQDLNANTTYTIYVQAVDTQGQFSDLSVGFTSTTLSSITVINGDTGINAGANLVNRRYTGQATVGTSQPVIFKFCEFKTSAGLNDHAAVFVNTNNNNSHVEFHYCKWEGQPQNNNHYQGKAVHVYGYNRANTFKVKHCTGTGYRGFWLQAMGTGVSGNIPNIDISNNVWSNINQYRHNGSGGYIYDVNYGPGENSQFVMIQSATLGTSGSVAVRYNYITNDDLASYIEDTINFYTVEGNASNPAYIEHNCLYGAFPYSAAGVKSFSGAQIQIEGLSRYVYANYNYCLNGGNTGPTVSWGVFCQINYSVILSSGYARGSDAYMCQSWRGGMIGNPFWQVGGTTDCTGTGNYQWWLENQTVSCVVSPQILVPFYVMENYTDGNNNVIDLRNRLYNTTNAGGTPLRVHEQARETEYLDNIRSSGIQLGYLI